MRALNILFLSEMKDTELFSDYENGLSDRTDFKVTKVHEQDSLHQFVAALRSVNLPIRAYEDFFFSYTIPHIGKEFDLIKIAADHSHILNVELKSKPIEEEKIQKQLVQNQYYLGHISKNIASFTYIASSSSLYCLNEACKLTQTSFAHLAEVMQTFDQCIHEEIETLFQAKDFLISPINTPDKFLERHYFLTSQQEQYKHKLLPVLSDLTACHFSSISGSPGTGKTLLLYDIGRELSAIGDVCIVHCGMLSDGHDYLNRQLSHVTIKGIQEIHKDTDFTPYRFLLIDETQRIYKEQMEQIIETVRQQKMGCVFAYDRQQILSLSEERRNTFQIIEEVSTLQCPLSEKIRTNRELSSFILSLFDLNRKTTRYDYSCVTVLFAQNEAEALKMLAYYEKEYTFINFTSSHYAETSFDVYGGEKNTHKVIGQEFDNVLMILDHHFYYNQDRLLCARQHPNPDYLYKKLFFQGISRARERLCLIVVGNKELFQEINDIKIQRIKG